MVFSGHYTISCWLLTDLPVFLCAADDEETNTSSANTTANDISNFYELSSLNTVSVPGRAFENATKPQTGLFFSLYTTSILFPLRVNYSENDTSFSTIGSSVISATVAGLEIGGLATEPVEITLAVTATVSSQSQELYTS